MRVNSNAARTVDVKREFNCYMWSSFFRQHESNNLFNISNQKRFNAFECFIHTQGLLATNSNSSWKASITLLNDELAPKIQFTNIILLWNYRVAASVLNLVKALEC